MPESGVSKVAKPSLFSGADRELFEAAKAPLSLACHQPSDLPASPAVM